MRFALARLAACAVLLAAPAPSRAADGGIEFDYAFEVENAGAATRTSYIRGFAPGVPVTLMVQLRQSGYVYILSSEGGRYHLAYPDPKQKKSAAIQVSEKLDPVKIVHMTKGTGVDRLLVVVSREAVPELEAALGKGDALNEMQALDIRDRYARPGLYTRDFKDDRVEVRYKGADARSAVVEEISLRRTPPATK